MKITPHRDHVLILPDKQDAKTAGGILLPEHYRLPPGAGTVMAVGPGRWNGGEWCPTCGRRHPVQFQPMDLKVGDRVAYRWIDVGQARYWEHERKTYIFLRRHEIAGIIMQEEAA